MKNKDKDCHNIYKDLIKYRRKLTAPSFDNSEFNKKIVRLNRLYLFILFKIIDKYLSEALNGNLVDRSHRVLRNPMKINGF